MTQAQSGQMPFGRPELILYLAVHRDDVDCIKSRGHVPLRFTSPKKSAIGLREDMEDAVKRYSLAFGSTPREELVVLQIFFTPLGIAHFTTNNCGAEHDFQCRLSKRIWTDDVDYGVWHFIGPLPLGGDRSDPLMSMQWISMETSNRVG